MMKKLIYILLFLPLFSGAQTPFEKGNQLYQKGQFQQAIQQYENILKTGQESAEVYFNIGNCYYKLNQVAPAIYYFEKALKLSPTDVEIQNNLAFAQKMTIDDIQEVPQVGLSSIITKFTSLLHYDTWGVIAIVLSIITLFCFIGYYYSYQTLYKRIYFTSMLSILFLIIIILFIGFFEKNRSESEMPAIIFADSAQIKSEPNPTASTAFTLHAGTKVNVLDSLDNFYKIQILDLKVGWVEKSVTKIIH